MKLTNFVSVNNMSIIKNAQEINCVQRLEKMMKMILNVIVKYLNTKNFMLVALANK